MLHQVGVSFDMEELLFISYKSKWPVPVAARVLTRGTAAALLLGMWVRIPPGAWTSVSCECCVLTGRGLCDGLTMRPLEFYSVVCLTVFVKPR